MPANPEITKRVHKVEIEVIKLKEQATYSKRNYESIENLKDQFNDLKKDTDYLVKVIKDGNGDRPMILKVEQMVNDLSSIKETVKLKLNHFEEKFHLELKNTETELTTEIKRIPDSIKKHIEDAEEKKELAEAQKKLTKYTFWKNRIVILIFGLLGGTTMIFVKPLVAKWVGE